MAKVKRDTKMPLEKKKSKQVTHKMSTINSWSRNLDIKKVKGK